VRNPAAEERRIRIRVQGTVQGVGFRPFVYRLAHAEALTGHVRNDRDGVDIEVEGTPSALARLLARIRTEAPPLAQIDHLAVTELVPLGARGFGILASPAEGEGAALELDTQVTPDAATCDDCRAELLDPGNRRYRYPFVNCTNCGPRLTIVDGIPYDRAQTTMASFTMCRACAAEYGDPFDRRFHAQPNACPLCGPQARLLASDGSAWDRREPSDARIGEDPVAAVAWLLAGGGVVAIKGLGGYHLAALAADEQAVATLRARKHREHKPFALMVASLETASTLVRLGAAERALLSAPAAPILLAPQMPLAPVADAVAPGHPELGVMLAHTPLHHLLLHDLHRLTGEPAVLVMTSGNRTGEPIAFDDADAVHRLGSIADAFLTHDRVICRRVDDSVVRRVAGGVRMLRRSRGYAPGALSLPVAADRDILACGAQLKSTFCLARGHRAWPSQHLGDLDDYAARVAYQVEIGQLEALLGVQPQLVAHDLHPDYASTAYALAREGVQRLGVQHHHAHLAACLAEQGADPDTVAVGAIFDGSGYGADGTVWGGEVLVGGLTGYARVGSLFPVRLPGGEAAIREPWRMALAWLAAAEAAETPSGALTDAGVSGGSGGCGTLVVPAVPRALRRAVAADRWQAVAQVAGHPLVSPFTSSVGRLFDAVAALCGIAPRVSYEGQAAVELTAAATGRRPRDYEIAIIEPTPARAGDGPRFIIDPRELIRRVSADSDGGTPVGEIAAGFHAALARVTARVCGLAATEAGTGTVVLGGGVFQNPLLLEQTTVAITDAGLAVLIPSRLPANDGGISFGQTAIAAAWSSAQAR
jgi:hydrogenase maturation protein HypF